MNPEKLRSSLPLYNCFKSPNSAEVTAYLHLYDINLVASGDAIAQTIGTLQASTYNLVAQAFFPGKAIGNAIVIHGYMDHTGLYSKLIRHLLRRGLNVYMVDLPGHGLSSGTTASIDDFSHYAAAVHLLQRETLKHCATGPWYLLGQSMGGSVAMLLMQQQAFAVKQLVLLAPLVQPRAWGPLKFLHMALKPFIRSIPRGFNPNSHDAAFTAFLKNGDPLQTRTIPIRWINAMRQWRKQFLLAAKCDTPTLLIQGSSDKTTDWRFGNKQIERLFPNSQQIIITQGMHQLANEAGPYLEQVFAAINGTLHDQPNQISCPD